jgi:hypothetical protein
MEEILGSACVMIASFCVFSFGYQSGRIRANDEHITWLETHARKTAEESVILAKAKQIIESNREDENV